MAIHRVEGLPRAVYQRVTHPHYLQHLPEPLTARVGDDVEIAVSAPGSTKKLRLALRDLYLPTGPYHRGRLHFNVGPHRHLDDRLRRRDPSRGGERQIAPVYTVDGARIIITGLTWSLRKTRR